jgi:soluble cytochrome b562
MVAYTLPERPDLIFSVRGKDSEKARQQAMEQLHHRIESEEIPADAFPNGVDPSDFIEVDSSKTSQPQTADDNNEVLQAVQTLSNLALLKIDLEKDRQAALEVYDVINQLLFGSEPVEEEEIDSLKQGFKTLKVFAQNHIKLQSSLPQAEAARDLLNQALYGESATVEKTNSKTAKTEKAADKAKGENGKT